MKWGKKIPDYDMNRNISLLSDGWIPLKEPKHLSIMILCSMPFMIIIGVSMYVLIDAFVGIDLKQFGIDFNTGEFTFSINLKVILGIVFIMLLHELIHLIFIPNFIKSRKTIIGLNIFVGFVYTEEMIGRNRFFVISLAPFVIISILFPIILGYLGLLTGLMVILIIINGAGASVDILNVILVLTQVSKTDMIVSNGSKTYWKKMSAIK